MFELHDLTAKPQLIIPDRVADWHDSSKGYLMSVFSLTATGEFNQELQIDFVDVPLAEATVLRVDVLQLTCVLITLLLICSLFT